MNITKILKLKKNQEKRLLSGHLWIYSNEIDVEKTPLTAFQPGDMVQVEGYQGKPLGWAYVNPHTLLCARLLTRAINSLFDFHLIEQRLLQALQLRQSYLSLPFYRLVYGESDGLPGLIIDRYGDYLAVQITTAGMEKFKNEIVKALKNILKPKGILFRCDSPTRNLEDLTTYIEIADGDIPEQIEIYENGARFLVSLTKGQKTGWFYDQRDNRRWVQTHAKDKRILDLFSYSGSFAIQAAVAGAQSVFSLDSSAQAIEWLNANARLNQVSDRVSAQITEIVPALKNLIAQNQQFDLILLDPPAFIKRRKDIAAGVRGYQRLHDLAMRLLTHNGLLVTSSCSLHCSAAMLTDIILQSSVRLKKSVKIIGQGHQALDHPVHPAISETNYLKTFFCEVNKDQ